MESFEYWVPLSPSQKSEALQAAFTGTTYNSAKRDDEEYVLELLQDLSDRFDALIFLIVDRRSLNAQDKEAARSLMTDLKDGLACEIADQKKRDDVSETEENFYYPAINEALSRIQVKVNSDPLKSNWHSELYSARIDIRHMLSQLESFMASKKKP